MKKISYFLAAFAACACMVSCSDNDGGGNPEGGTKLVIDASSYGSWTFVDFSTNTAKTFIIGTETDETLVTCASYSAGTYNSSSSTQVVTYGTESADLTAFDWDVAFRQTVIKTNGGKVTETAYTSLDDVTSATGASWTGDTEIPLTNGQSSSIYTGMPPTTYVYDTSYNMTMIDTDISGGMGNYVYTPSTNVFIIENEAGEQYKIKVTDYQDVYGTNGIYTIYFDEL